MNQLRKTKGLFETLLIVGLILIIPLFFAIKTAADKQDVQNTATAIHIPTSPSVTMPSISSPAIVAKQPPQCTFPLAQTATTESVPEEYTFSEPQVVLTAEASIIEIVEWLPDNQRVLITQEIGGNTQQNIELFNPQDGERQLYATRRRMDEHPAWVAGLNAVVYPATNILKYTKTNGMNLPPYDVQRQLWISRGNPASVELIEDDQMTLNYVPVFSVAVKPDGSQFIYRTDTDKQLFQRNTSSASLEIMRPSLFDSTQWEYREDVPAPLVYDMAWRPGASQVFLYTVGDTGGYTFLLDTDTGRICEIALGSEGNESGWAVIARWSPNGRYLAMARTWGRLPVDTSDLVILDTMTGKLYTMKIIPSDMGGLHFVNDVAWAPDSQHLTAIAQVLVQDPATRVYNKISSLYFVDFISNQAIQISSPNDNLGSGLGRTNLIWSDNGSQLLVKCPTDQMDRLCLLSVQKADHK